MQKDTNGFFYLFRRAIICSMADTTHVNYCQVIGRALIYFSAALTTISTISTCSSLEADRCMLFCDCLISETSMFNQ